MSKNILFTLACVSFGALYAADTIQAELGLFRANLKNCPENYAILRESANDLIFKGVLRGILLNGQLTDYPTGALENCSDYKELVEKILLGGDTITASPRMLRAEVCIKGVLNLENMQLVTVRDWQYQEWFKNVLVINLAHNQLNEVPVPFFKLFPNARKYIFTANPIKHLDTTYMQDGVTIDCTKTHLESISSRTLTQSGFIFLIAGTPLASDQANLKMLIDACKKANSIMKKLFDGWFGKDIESEEGCLSSQIHYQITTYAKEIQQQYQ